MLNQRKMCKLKFQMVLWWKKSSNLVWLLIFIRVCQRKTGGVKIMDTRLRQDLILQCHISKENAPCKMYYLRRLSFLQESFLVGRIDWLINSRFTVICSDIGPGEHTFYLATHFHRGLLQKITYMDIWVGQHNKSLRLRRDLKWQLSHKIFVSVIGCCVAYNVQIYKANTGHRRLLHSL